MIIGILAALCVAYIAQRQTTNRAKKNGSPTPLFSSLKAMLGKQANHKTAQKLLPLCIGDRAFLLDLGVIIAVSLAIFAAAHQLRFMSIFVPSLFVLRFLAWTKLTHQERGHSTRTEVILLLLCTCLGAFNDWNSVVRHNIYAYTLPHYFPALSTIPIWMLLYWGMILRFFISLFQWHRLSPSPQPRNTLHLPGLKLDSPYLKVGIQILLMIATRQLIYRFYAHPILSWLPFALALVLYILFFPPDAHDRKLLCLVAVGGPLIEVLYIQLGQMYLYAQGWLGGVPLWILLWWLLSQLIWKDLSARFLLWLKPT